VTRATPIPRGALHLLRPIAPVLAALALAACALTPQAPPGAAATSASSGSASSEAPIGTAPRGSAASGAGGGLSASAALLERSRAERAAGSYDQAAASVERALRIEPNDPALWLELGEIKLAAGDAQQAGLMARKALTLAGGDGGFAARAERLIDAAAH
jgi:cytochrome c-type biogenesis protein CcmH/NrfG